MEFRKVQKTGGSTYIISLPKEWALKNNIKDGDILTIKENENGHLIIAKEISEREIQKEIELNVKKESEDLILRKLIALYLNGFNTIRVYTDSITDEIKNAIMKFTTLSLGVEIVEETNRYFLLQDLSKFSDLPMEKILQRLYIMTENMLIDTKNLFNNFNENLAKDIMDRDTQIDRLFWLISKQFYTALKNNSILKDQGLDITRAFNIRSIAKLFERIGDHSVGISSTMVEYKLQNGKIILPYFDKVLDIFKNSYLSYKTLDIDLANNVVENSHKFHNDVKNLLNELEKKKIKDISSISSIFESLIRIAMYSADLSEITIDEKMSNL
ncbi:MAG: PhoU domain-containing protein [Thermoplasmata archaeon]|nr:phosphate uptake regulator PhoU [Thermoplasmata archaeon]